MTQEERQVNLVLEALVREGIISAVSEDEFTMTQTGMIKASTIIADDFEQQMEVCGYTSFDEQSEKLILEEFARSIAESPTGVLGYLVAYYRSLSAKT